MEATVILLFIILSALAALIALLLFKKKPESPVDEAALDYAEGLNLLLCGKKDEALKKLRQTVAKDSQNIDAYLKIGDILRELGQVERAINVHKYLTVRSGLSLKQQQNILHSLAEDYRAAQQFDKALNVINKVLEQDRHVLWALEMKLALYEAKEDWPRAFQTYKDLRQKNGELKNDRLALYKVQEGLKLLKSQHEKEAQSRFKDAIKIAPNCPPGYIYLADSYIKEERKSDALSVLKQFVEKVPSQSFLAFERIKELLYEGGVYGEIENLYLDIIKTQPDNLMARLALAENYEKKGETDKAIATCLSVLEKEAENKTAKSHLVRLYHKSGDSTEALRIALELIDEASKHKEEHKFDITQFL
ncbi:MAG: tetratricopeptide repeat protein [bacterium]